MIAPFSFYHSPFLAALVGCLGTAPATRAESPFSFAPPSHLTASLVGRDIDLRWSHAATAPGACWIEFSTPGDDFTKLDVVAPGTTTYRHPMVMSGTKFIYRVRPSYGKPSAEVELTTGTGPQDAAGNGEEEGPLPPQEAGEQPPKLSIRSAANFADAAPDGLTAKLSQPTHAELRWHDRSTDEDGFLVEISAAGDGAFSFCALQPPDATSFRKIQLPAGRKCRFRVSAFFYGEASATASVVTPPQPEKKE